VLADLDQHHRAAHRHVIWRQTEHDSEGAEGDDCTGRTFIFCSSWEEGPAHIAFPFVYPFGALLSLSLRASRRKPARANARDRHQSIWESASMHSLPLELVDETALVSGYVNGWLVACEGEGYGGLVAVGGSSARARRRPTGVDLGPRHRHLGFRREKSHVRRTI
jgi:hypothetical protein